MEFEQTAIDKCIINKHVHLKVRKEMNFIILFTQRNHMLSIKNQREKSAILSKIATPVIFVKGDNETKHRKFTD